MDKKTDGGWNPYVAGALSGLLITFSVLLTGNYFGASTTVVRITAAMERLLDPRHFAAIEYFSRFAPSLDWQWMFVGGIMLGSFVSAVTSGTFRLKALPDMWVERFGPGRTKRAAVAFAGGAMAIYGARLAGGCTSGHGLSGSLQLAVSGLIVLFSLFAGGMLAARAVYAEGRTK